MKRSETILAAIGLGLFGLVASRIGWAALFHQVKAAWLAIPVLVGFSWLRLLLQTLSWRTALQEEGVKSTFGDRKSTRLNSSHVSISYAVFCLKKKNLSIVSFCFVIFLALCCYLLCLN